MFAVLAGVALACAVVYAAISPLAAFRVLVTMYLVVPTAVGFRAPAGFPVPIVSLARTYFAGFLIGFVINRMLAQVARRPVPSMAAYFAVYVAYLVAASFFSLSREYDLKAVLSERIAGAGVIFFLAYGAIRRTPDFLYLLRGLYVGLVIIAVIALWEAATGTRFNNLAVIHSLSELDPESYTRAVGGTGLAERGGLVRVESTYEHSIYLGLALTMLLPFLLTLSTRVRSWLASMTLPGSILAAILTVSRTAWFSIVAAAFFAGRRRRTLLLLTALAALLLGIPFLTESFRESSYVDTSALSTRSRLDLLLNTAQNLTARTALFGIGVGGLDYLGSDPDTRQFFELATRSLQRLPRDNSLAASLLTTGAVGTALFLAIFLRLARDLYQAMRGAPMGIRRLLLQATLSCLIIELAIFFISNSVFQNPRLSAVFFALLGSGLGIAGTSGGRSPEPEPAAAAEGASG